MNLETLQQKRTVLVAQKDQILANLNASIGAISMMDELIAEAAAEESRCLATAAQLAQAAQDIASERAEADTRVTVDPLLGPVKGVDDGEPFDLSRDAAILREPASPLDNLPVINIDARGADAAAVDRLTKAVTKKAANRKSSPATN